MYSYSYQYDKGRNLIKALVRTADGNITLLSSPQYTGLEHCRVGDGRSTPFLYSQPSGLKLLFACTSVYTLDWTPELRNARRVELEPLTDKSLHEVLDHICLLYDSAYGFLEEDPTIDSIFRKVTDQSGRTRSFVKGSVEALDLARLGHNEISDKA